MRDGIVFYELAIDAAIFVVRSMYIQGKEGSEWSGATSKGSEKKRIISLGALLRSIDRCRTINVEFINSQLIYFTGSSVRLT